MFNTAKLLEVLTDCRENILAINCVVLSLCFVAHEYIHGLDVAPDSLHLSCYRMSALQPQTEPQFYEPIYS